MTVATVSNSIEWEAIVKADEKNICRRSRGWTPLKYPNSAILSDQKDAASLPYFPLHPDVISAAVRELLILEGKLDNLTLKVIHEKTVSGEHGSENCESTQTVYDVTRECGDAGRPIKRLKRSSVDRGNIKFCRSDNRHEEDELFHNTVENGRVVSGRLALAEDVVLSIVQSARVVSTVTLGILPHWEESPSSDISQAVVARPRKVSEADQALPSAHSTLCTTEDNNDDCSEAYSREISCFLDLTRRDENGYFPVFSCGSCIPTMLHVSISNEAILRDAAMMMTTKLIQHFQERSLRMFFGYKTTAISCNRLAQLMAGFLFDASHAMFAWAQTEKELLAQNPNIVDPDTAIRKALFNQRALKKLGGFKSHGILPQSISIGRLRRRNVSWEEFATTAQGKQMLDHHAKEIYIIAAGKQRLGQRLRQRHWLTSAILWNENEETSIGTPPRSRSCSIFSETDVEFTESCPKGGIVDFDLTRQSRILLDMPGSKVVVLVKGSSATSWGVGLVQEGSACVVGRAEAHHGSSTKSYLQCGDIILCVQNEHGEEAGCPLCSWSGIQPTGEGWFQRMVDLIKNSTELHLVIQRV